PEGETSMLVDQGELEAVVRQWQSGNFTEEDRAWARQWREASQSFRKATLTDRLEKHHVILPRPSSLADWAPIVKDLLDRAALQSIWLQYLTEELTLSRSAMQRVHARWAEGFGFLERFAPYAHHCMRVILTVTLAARHRLIRWEPTTVID